MPTENSPLNCETPNPMVVYGETNNPFVVNYKIPYTSEITLYSNVLKEFEQSKFVENPTEANDEDKFWDELEKLNASQVKALLLYFLNNTSFVTYFFSNFEIIKSSKVVVVFYDSAADYNASANAGTTWVSSGIHYGKELLKFGGKKGFAGLVNTNDNKLNVSNNTKPVYGQYKADTVFFDVNLLAEEFANGKKAYITLSLNGQPQISFGSRPNINHVFTIMMEVKTLTLPMGTGLGEVIKTFSLMPGEETTITVKTYKDSEATTAESSNILETQNESSLSSFENQINEFTGSSNNFNYSYQSGKQWGINGSISAGAQGVQGSIGGGFTKTVQSGIQSGVNFTKETLDNALTTHVNESNSYRQIEINTSTTNTVREGESSEIVRTLKNPNLSRVQNFFFRQMLNKYKTVTYINDIKFLYTDGFSDNTRIVSIGDLKALIDVVIQSEYRAQVFNELVDYSCTLFNYNNEAKTFFTKVTRETTGCASGDPYETDVWMKNPALTDNTGDPNPITVKGVIINVKDFVLKSDSYVPDVLLGQGEALDCYNSNMQAETVVAAKLNNQQKEKALEILDSITDPVAKAEAYRKMFSDCCNDNPVDINVDVNANTTQP